MLLPIFSRMKNLCHFRNGSSWEKNFNWKQSVDQNISRFWNEKNLGLNFESSVQDQARLETSQPVLKAFIAGLINSWTGLFLSFLSLHDSNQDIWKYKFIDDNDNGDDDDDDAWFRDNFQIQFYFAKKKLPNVVFWNQAKCTSRD